jgi:hypothetical protein
MEFLAASTLTEFQSLTELAQSLKRLHGLGDRDLIPRKANIFSPFIQTGSGAHLNILYNVLSE